MEILSSAREKGSLAIAGLAVLFLGLGLSASAWHNLNRQRQALDQHLYLAAGSVLQTIGATLRRDLAMRTMRGPDALNTAAEVFFREVETSGEVLFVAAMAADGKRFILAEEGRWEKIPSLDVAAMDRLREEGEWHGIIRVDGKEAYVIARKIRRPGMGMHGGVGPGSMGMRHRPGVEGDVPGYLAVGLDMERHLALYTSLKKSILFTVGYVLLAAVLVMGLALAVIRRQGAARRVESLELLQAKLLDAMPDGLLLVDGLGRIQAANPAAHIILGMPEGTLAGRSVKELPLPLTGNELQMNEWQYHEIQERRLELLTLPLPEGYALGEQAAAESVSGEAGGLMVLVRDRTQLKNLELNLAEARKLAALGTLAAGVAHEVRNPLSALRGFAQFFAKKFAGTLPEETYALTMVREADRLNRVVSDLLHLARPRAMSPKELELEPLIEEVIRLVEQEIHSQKVKIVADIQIPSAFADEDGLKQALLNLGLNALEALATDPDRTDGLVTIASHQDGSNVVISVSDNGPGMEEEARQQAFEPFFTTKAKGTGLGLALVHKLAREHGGCAKILSQPGGGARVELYFPDRPDEPGQKDAKTKVAS